MKSIIIDRLIQIEESAHDITQEIEEKERNLPVTIQEKCTEIDQEFDKKFKEKEAAIKAAKAQEADARVADIQRDSTARYQKLDSYYEENHEQWETELFNSIIGR